ncbi:MAG TPA: hypothetical protein PKD00_03190 [Burkholderiales bacterium]|nr:hypothetical protein [Burkholderiales bacterium]
MEFKPVAMKCTQEQFDAIKPKLSSCTIIQVTSFTNSPYLVNNYGGIVKNITNIFCDNQDRTVYETWNEKIFLEACGINTISLNDEYIVECNSFFEANIVSQYLIGKNTFEFYPKYIINHKDILNSGFEFDIESNVIPAKFKHLPVLSFFDWKELINQQKKEMKKINYKITCHQALLLIEAACKGNWKEKLIIKWFDQIIRKEEIEVSSEFLDEMLNASNSDQKKVLYSVFNIKPNIDYTKLTTGSIVKIKKNSSFYGDNFDKLSIDTPVNIIFYKTPHGITWDNHFFKSIYQDSYSTFEQNGNFFLYSADGELDYITEVISY